MNWAYHVPLPLRTSIKLVEAGFLTKMKLGRDNFYLNMKLFDLLINAFHVDMDEANSQQVETIG